MKLSKRTTDILKNFSSINDGIAIHAGSNKLRTISKQKSIFATATLEDAFPKNAAFHDLNMLLAVVGKENAELEFGETSVTIKSPYGKDIIVYCPEDVIITPPKDKNLVLDKSDISFTISPEQIQAILTKANVMGLPNIVVTNDDGTLVLKALDRNNKSSHSSSIELGSIDKALDFQLFFLVDELKLLDETYNVEISASRGISRFVNTAGNLEYFIAIEKQGSYFKKA